jgi:hypothetical protein
VQNAMQKLKQLFLFTNIYTAAGAAFASMGTMAVFGKANLHIAFYIFMFCATLSSYCLHWYFTPNSANDERSQWSITTKKILALIGVISFLIGLLQWYFLPLQFLIYVLPLVLFSLLYSAPKIPMQPFVQLRSQVRWKTLYLSLAWTYATSLLPLLLDTSSALPNGIYSYVLSRWSLIFIACLLFDYRDHVEDQQAGIKTILYTLGQPLLVTLITVLISFGILNNVHLFGLISHTAWAINFLPFLILMFIFKKSFTTKDEWFYTGILDGMMYLVGFIFLLKKFML